MQHAMSQKTRCTDGSGQLVKLHAIPEKPEHHEQTGAWFIEGEKTFNGKKTPGAAL